jgi:hypothetical protein
MTRTSFANAQFLKKLGNAAKDKAENKINQKNDKNADNTNIAGAEKSNTVNLNTDNNSGIKKQTTKGRNWKEDIKMSFIPGAKMYFSDKPFGDNHDGAKTTFSSSDYIYGRIELDNKTMLDAFKLPKEGTANMTMDNKGDCVLRFGIGLYKNGKLISSWDATSPYMYVTAAQKGKTAFNFDIAASVENFSSRVRIFDGFKDKGTNSPFYERFNQGTFPSSGEYTFLIVLYNESLNEWGSKENSQNFPVVADVFNYNFSISDIASIKERQKNLTEKSRIEYVDKLPAYFAKPLSISDQSVTIAKVTPIIKNYLGSEYQVLKVAIEPSSSMWSTVKNNLGIRSYRYVTSFYKIVYRQNGQCQLGSIRIAQDYIGNEKWGNLYVSKFYGEEGVIECSKVK